jgi:hypothetical protein
MAIKNIPLTVRIPGRQEVSAPIVFAAAADANDHFRIPRRYPFADISNYNALVAAGFLRHGLKQNQAGTTSTAVSTELGGSVTTNTEGVLGFALPNTEKLILLVKKGATTAEAVTFEGSIEYRIPDLTITIPAGAIGDVFELDLYDFGLFIEGISGEPGLLIKSATDTLEFALLTRTA